MNAWQQAAARAHHERERAAAVAFVRENYDEHAELSTTGVILLTLDGFHRLRVTTRGATPRPLEHVLLGIRRVSLITRMPGAIKHTGTVQSIAGDRATVRWDDDARSSVRLQFLSPINPGGRP